jgi:hypothetical protein
LPVRHLAKRERSLQRDFSKLARVVRGLANASFAIFRVAIFCGLLAVTLASAQEPPVAPPSQTENTQSHGKHSHANDFLVKGTVFTDKAYALPGVEVRLRRSGEKKFRWERYSNSRGEFGVIVPRGAEYEMVLHVKGFVDQSRSVDARTGDSLQDLTFSMEPVGSKK